MSNEHILVSADNCTGFVLDSINSGEHTALQSRENDSNNVYSSSSAVAVFNLQVKVVEIVQNINANESFGLKVTPHTDTGL